MRLADALRDLGCRIDFFDFSAAFSGQVASLSTSSQFPLRLASVLLRTAHRYDVIDASSGDAWLWATLRRPGGNGSALFFRSHGLEHTTDRRVREDVRAGRRQLRQRYYVYHGGVRLWEVARSMRLADHAIFLNEEDLRYSTEQLALPRHKASIIPHGLAGHFLEKPLVEDSAPVPLTAAFIGTWNDRKGRTTVVDAIQKAKRAKIDIALRLLGTGQPAACVMQDFPDDVRGNVTVVPEFENERLADLLDGCSILLSPSRSEGFNLGLLEGMACGLVPLTTGTGEAPRLIVHGSNGYVLPWYDAEAFARVMVDLACRPRQLSAMRRNAQRSVAAYRWGAIAATTLDLYIAVRERRHSQRLP